MTDGRSDSADRGDSDRPVVPLRSWDGPRDPYPCSAVDRGPPAPLSRAPGRRPHGQADRLAEALCVDTLPPRRLYAPRPATTSTARSGNGSSTSQHLTVPFDGASLGHRLTRGRPLRLVSATARTARQRHPLRDRGRHAVAFRSGDRTPSNAPTSPARRHQLLPRRADTSSSRSTRIMTSSSSRTAQRLRPPPGPLYSASVPPDSHRDRLQRSAMPSPDRGSSTRSTHPGHAAPIGTMAAPGRPRPLAATSPPNSVAPKRWGACSRLPGSGLENVSLPAGRLC